MSLLHISLIFYRRELIVKYYYSCDPSTGQHSPSSKGYCDHSVSQKIRSVFFKLWESNLSQFFKTYFKGEGLKLIASICKRDKSDLYSPGLFLLETCFRWGWRQTFHWSFPPLVRLSPFLTNTDDLLVPFSLLILPSRCHGDAPGVDLTAPQIDFKFLITKTFVWFVLFLWYNLEWRE